jgi:hypothetical protein
MSDDLYTGPDVAPEEILSVYLVMNGALGMSPGKLAAMAFHCGRRIGESRAWPEWHEWYKQGPRIVVRMAETPTVFERVCSEVEGFKHHDEGLTEVEYGACVAFCSIPYRRDSVPSILSHKRCQLL